MSRYQQGLRNAFKNFNSKGSSSSGGGPPAGILGGAGLLVAGSVGLWALGNSLFNGNLIGWNLKF